MIIILIAAWWLFTGRSSDEARVPAYNTATTNSTSSSATNIGATAGVTTAIATGEEITVEDQPAGDSVRVSEAKLSRNSWIAVRDSMRIYGAARVNPPAGGGTIGDISIPLLRNTVSGATYSVVVYADDGDNMFDFKKDALVEGLDDSFSALHGD